MSATEHNGGSSPTPNGNGKRAQRPRHPALKRPPKALNSANPEAPRSNLRPLKNALALGLGEQLYKRSLALLRDRIAMCEEAHKLIREEMAKRTRGWKQRIEEIRSAFGLSAADLRAFVSETGDRYGQPRRSVQDVNVAGGPTPLKLILDEHDPAETTEAADAARSSDGAGTQH